ncbi:MAG: hypothetical protein M3Y27_09285 [Acidobacteriota bacterium]|nr:hypothetical protein [Acidobacteriota bacterium]
MNRLEQAFENFLSEAFRFEGLADYRVPEEAPILTAYLNGELFAPEKSASWQNYFAEWHAFVRKRTADGRRLVRVRMIPSVISPYVNMELEWGYPHNIEAGEEVFVITEADCRPIFAGNPGDFWLFDKVTAIDMHYSSDGSFIDATSGKLTSGTYLRLRDALLKKSISLREYLKKRRTTHQF